MVYGSFFFYLLSSTVVSKLGIGGEVCKLVFAYSSRATCSTPISPLATRVVTRPAWTIWIWTVLHAIISSTCAQSNVISWIGIQNSFSSMFIMKEEFYNLCNWIISSILVHEKYLSRRKYTRKNFIVIYYISLAVKQEIKSLKFEYNSNYIPFRRDRNDRLIILKDSSSSATFSKKRKKRKINERKLHRISFETER